MEYLIVGMVCAAGVILPLVFGALPSQRRRMGQRSQRGGSFPAR